MRIYQLKFLTVFLFAILITGCNQDDSQMSGTTTRLEIRLTDSPGSYSAVNIDIQSVYINANSDSDGWKQLTLIKPGVYNLLKFQNGLDTLLAGEDVPAGKISQIRLVLGSNNSIEKNGVSYPLETPSAQQSGLKLNVHYVLNPGILYQIWIDFDASRSIVATGSGKYLLKPVIRTFTNTVGGTITGVVLPAEANPTVLAILNTDTILSYPDSSGKFLIPGLAASESWKIVFEADKSTLYKNQELSHIKVETGKVTTLDTVTLVK